MEQRRRLFTCHLQNKSSNGNVTAKATTSAEHTKKIYDNFTVIIDSKISLKYIVCYLAPDYLTTKVTFIFIFIFILEYWRKFEQKQRSPNAICNKDSNKETTKTAPQNKVSVPIIYFGYFRNTDFFKKTNVSDCSIHLYFSY